MHRQWIALTNTTLGVLMAGINSSILLIALPAIFRGLGVNPPTPPTRASCYGFYWAIRS